MRGSLERILIDAVRYTSTRDSLGDLRQGDPQRKIRRALTYLHHHFRDPVTLAEVACQAHLSPHYFSSCFHEATGASFQRYLCDLRLRFARSLLAVSSASVTDLCLASGFSTLSNFERAFKTCYGCSPRVFRARIELDS
jgi:AraC-like DNA-binding protein